MKAPLRCAWPEKKKNEKMMPIDLKTHYREAPHQNNQFSNRNEQPNSKKQKNKTKKPEESTRVSANTSDDSYLLEKTRQRQTRRKHRGIIKDNRKGHSEDITLEKTTKKQNKKRQLRLIKTPQRQAPRRSHTGKKTV